LAAHPNADPDNVRHTLILLELPPLERLQRGLIRGRATAIRWEQGSQYPSRSMGYYLRTLREFPEAFAWLRARGWKGGKSRLPRQVPPRRTAA
jgi:hypothetical protein